MYIDFSKLHVQVYQDSNSEYKEGKTYFPVVELKLTLDRNYWPVIMNKIMPTTILGIFLL